MCRKWREVLYQPPYWKDLRPVLHCRDLRSWNSSEEWRENKRSFYTSIKLRGHDNICLLHANDADVFDFIQNYPHGAKHIHTLRYRYNFNCLVIQSLIYFTISLVMSSVCDVVT